MGLWDWMLQTYERPGVPEACLALQDGYLLNTTYLLWTAWANPHEAALLSGLSVSAPWDQILWALRNARRDLKPSHAGIDDAARLALREDVKAAELRAEQVLAQALEALAGPAAGPVDLSRALAHAAEVWRNKPPPAKEIAELAAALA